MSRPTPSAANVRSWSAEELEAELGRVHAREFARLLCRAARLKDLDLAAWRRDALHARALAEIDGFELPGVLRHALGHEPAEWAEPARLVAAGVELLGQQEQSPW